MIQVTQLPTGGYDDNFSYVLTAANGETAIVDPCGDVEMIKNALNPNCIPEYILLTHSHHDHISGIPDTLKFFPAKIAAHSTASCCIDLPLKHKDVLHLGELHINCLHAPGHTEDSMIYHISDNSAIFTGDTLFVDYCGYCDAKKMYNTLKNIVFPLNDSNVVYSGHNYGHKPFDTLKNQKKVNPYLASAALSFDVFRNCLLNL